MLRELSVQNLALIEDLQVELGEGYCVWTGETGAGKSLLLQALGLVLGKKGSADLVREGKPEARASAIFEVNNPDLRDDLETILGGAIDDDLLILTRRVAANGRSSAQVNGLPVPLVTLQNLGQRLIDIHGQNEGRALADPDQQRSLLDAYGQLGPLLAEYRSARREHETLRLRRQALLKDAETRLRERALLEFERDEIAGLGPIEGEVDELNQEARRLGNSEAIRETSGNGYRLLYEASPSAQGLLERVGKELSTLTGSLPEFARIKADLDRIAEETRELAYSLREISRGASGDPKRLEAIEERLAHYRKVSARFRCGPDELVVQAKEIALRLDAIVGDDNALEGLDQPLEAAWVRLMKGARALSEGRHKAACQLGKAVQKRLRPLGMSEARLEVEIQTLAIGDDPKGPTPAEAGLDRVDMIFSANPGEGLRPLRKVASGGELSRLTLALKTVLAEADRVPTLIFDEIDTGVGGRLGGILGKTLAELARHHQVICVTHLPQMASHARRQWVIQKQVEQGRTKTTILPLDEKGRVEELALMLRGDSVAEGTRKEALSMLLEAQGLP